MKKKLFFASTVFMHTFLSSEASKAQTKIFTVKVNEIKAEIQPTMWGIFLKTSTWARIAGFMQNWLKIVRSSFTRR